MAVVLVQNGVHSSPKSHFMHDEVGNDISFGASFGGGEVVFDTVALPCRESAAEMTKKFGTAYR